MISFRFYQWLSKLGISATVLAIVLIGAKNSLAQPIVPANDGTGTIVSPDVNNPNHFNINGGSLSADEANLFHSFQQFGLNPDQIANFLSQPNIRNILGRVVGGDPSVIQGLIRVSGGNANLYLVNPSGIIFSPTARLDVPANFAATTANGIQLDQDWFNAIGANNYAALNGDPSAFAFTGESGDIVNAAELTLEPGKVLTFVANSVANTGEITAPDGQVILASMPKPGIVRLSQPGQVLSVEYQVANSEDLPEDWSLPVANLGEMLSGSQDYDLGFQLNGDGTVQLKVSPIQVSPIKIAPEPGTTIASGTIDTSGETGGQVSILGNTVAVVGANINASGTQGGGTVLVGGALQGQGLTPTAQRTIVDATSTINVDAVETGQGGEAIVWADGRTDFAGTITAKGGATQGDGGFVEVSGKQSLGFTGTVDTTAVNGSTGTLLLDPTDILITNGTSGIGDSEFFSLGSTVVSSYTPLSGEPFTISESQVERSLLSSNVSLAATNNITIADLTDNTLGNFSSSIGSLTLTADADNSGAGTVSMTSGDTIAINGSITASGASLNLGSLNTFGGNINLTATGNIETRTITASTGNVQLTTTTGDVVLNGQIRTVNSGSGNSGNITINSGGSIDASNEFNFTLNNDINNLGTEYTLNTYSASGLAGNVFLTAQNDITLGLIDTDADQGAGNISLTSRAGNIKAIVSNVPVTAGDSTGTVNVGILNAGSDQGNGGTVSLSAAGNVEVGLILTGTVDGNGGNVTIASTNGSVSAISSGSLTSSTGVTESAEAGAIVTGTAGAGQGGNVTITAPGNIRTGWILTGSLGGNLLSPAGTSLVAGGGNVSLTSTAGTIDTTINVSNIDASLLVDLGLTASQATLASQVGTELGLIVTGSQNGDGGTVNLNAASDIRTGAIISGSQNRNGGAVTLTSSSGAIDTSNDQLLSGATREAWLAGAEAAGLATTDTVSLSDLGLSDDTSPLSDTNGNPYTVDQLATLLDGVSLRLGVITGSEDGTGGAVTFTANGDVKTSNIITASLNGNGGAIQLTSTTGAIDGQEAILANNVDSSLLQALGLEGDAATVIDYFSDPTVALGGYITLSLNGNAGSITLNAAGDVLTNYLVASSFSGRGGNISITSGGTIDIGRVVSNASNGIFPSELNGLTDDRADQIARLLARGSTNSSGSTGAGNISIQAETSITADGINSSSDLGNGGNVLLDPTGDIEVYTINTQGGSGGNVTIATDSNFRALGTFNDRNGIPASISTAGNPNGGRISITHGGNGEVAFKLGDASLNGTAGAITSGNFTIFPAGFSTESATTLTRGNPFLIAPSEGYFLTERLANGFDNATGAIGIFTLDREREIENNCEVLATCSKTKIPDNAIGIASSEGRVLSIDEARDILALVEERSGIKPALIYVNFESTNFQLLGAADQFSNDEAKFSQAFEQHLDIPDRLDGLALNLVPSDKDQLRILVVTANEDPYLVSVPGATRDQVVFSGNQMWNSIFNQEPEAVYLRPSQQLYNQLIAPISAVLEERKVQNLVFIMDNSLRLLPLAALHDGKQYLVEKYSVGLMPSLSLTDTRFVDIKDVQVLAMGADEFSDEAPLISVPDELNLITNLWSAQAPLINDDFTIENLRSARSAQRYGILHLATHGDFNAGSIDQSYIRFGDRRVTFDQFRTLKLNDPPVELMVLSACRTAVGSVEAELGFAGLANQAGVKSALGSLWYVGDQATLGLMTSFYESLREAPIKAEALREAQLAMLKGEVTLSGGQINTPRGSFPLRSDVAETLQNVPTDLTHPYAWSAFTMIGSPW